MSAMTPRTYTGLKILLEHNPYHDAQGRFTTPGNAKFVTLRTRSGKVLKSAQTERSIDGLMKSGYAVIAVHREFSPEESLRKVFGKIPNAKELDELSGINTLKSHLDAKAKGGVKASKLINISKDKVTLTMSVEDKHDNSTMAEVTRFYSRDSESNRLKVEHSYFVIRDDYKGGGIGRAVIKTQLESYRKYGGAEIKVEAGLSEGTYVWARMGFSPTDGSWAKISYEISRAISTAMKVPLPKAMEIVQGYRDRIWDLADLRTQSGEKLGKSIFKNKVSSWIGTLVVPGAGKPSNPGFDQAMKYISQSKAR